MSFPRPELQAELFSPDVIVPTDTITPEIPTNVDTGVSNSPAVSISSVTASCNTTEKHLDSPKSRTFPCFFTHSKIPLASPQDLPHTVRKASTL